MLFLFITFTQLLHCKFHWDERPREVFPIASDTVTDGI